MKDLNIPGWVVAIVVAVILTVGSAAFFYLFLDGDPEMLQDFFSLSLLKDKLLYGDDFLQPKA